MKKAKIEDGPKVRAEAQARKGAAAMLGINPGPLTEDKIAVRSGSGKLIKMTMSEFAAAGRKAQDEAKMAGLGAIMKDGAKARKDLKDTGEKLGIHLDEPQEIGKPIETPKDKPKQHPLLFGPMDGIINALELERNVLLKDIAGAELTMNRKRIEIQDMEERKEGIDQALKTARKMAVEPKAEIPDAPAEDKAAKGAKEPEPAKDPKAAEKPERQQRPLHTGRKKK
jgi:hypothetical protein